MISTKEVYDSIVSDYSKKVKSDMLDHKYIERFLFYLKYGAKVLDAGAGNGSLSFEMQSLHGLNVTAIDFSAEMIKFAKKKYPKIKFKEMDLQNLRFKSKSFDAIFANYSLIHIKEENFPTVLESFNRVLKNKGYLYISLQSPNNVKQRDGYYPLAYKKSSNLFINLIKTEEIKKHLKKANFKVLEMYQRKPDLKTEFPFNKLFIIAEKINM